MKRLLLYLTFALACVLGAGCQNKVVLESGGAYSEVDLAITDRSILDAAHALDGFVSWHQANATYLAKWPEVGELSAKVRAHRNGWIQEAYAARDAYAVALKAYRAGQGTSPDRARVNAAIAILNEATKQIAAYRAAHPHA